LADSSDEAVCHEDVACWQVAQVRVDGHDVAALYQQFFRHDLSLSLRQRPAAARLKCAGALSCSHR
jgi:hypothetical protein